MPTVTKLDTWIAALVALLAAAIFYPFAAIGVDPHHDGIMLKPALDVLSGQVLFRDTFSQYGPLTTYLQAWVLGIQPTLLSLRLLTVAAYAGSLFFLYLAWRSLLPRSLSLVASLMFIVWAPFYHPVWLMLPWSSALALFFQSIAIWALLRIVGGRPHAAWAWTLGIACACTLWCRQPVGVILTGSVGIIAVGLHLTGWRPSTGSAFRVWGRVGLGFGVISLLILGQLGMNGALGAFWGQNVTWPGRWAHTQGTAWDSMFIRPDYALGLAGLMLAGGLPTIARRFWPGLPRWLALAWLGCLVAGYMAFGHAWVRTWLLLPEGGWNGLIMGAVILQAVLVLFLAIAARPKAADYHLAAVLAGLALAASMQVYPVPCPNHLYWAFAPGFGVFVYLCWRWSRAEAWVCGLLVLLFLLPAGYDKYCFSRYTLSQPLMELQSPPLLAGMKVELARGQALQRVDAVLQALLALNPDRPGLLYGYDAIYLTWFRNRENPSPYYVTWIGLQRPDDQISHFGFLVQQQPVLLLHKYRGNEPRPDAAMLKLLKAVGYRVIQSEPELSLFIAVPIDPVPTAITP
jgi:hypothetical protein